MTLANDAWFGDSQEPWLHLAWRGCAPIEQRRFLVRATNSGISAVIDPLGRVTAQTPIGAEATLRAEVPLLAGQTVYARLGDWPGPLAALLLAGGLRRKKIIPAL